MKFVSPHAALLAASQPARLGRKNTMASLMLAAARKVKAGQAAERNAWADRAGAGKTHFAAVMGRALPARLGESEEWTVQGCIALSPTSPRFN